jgi:hypothetical protein
MDGVCCWCSGSLCGPLIYTTTTTFYLGNFHTNYFIFKNVEILFYFILFPPNDKNLCKVNIEFLRILKISKLIDY